MADSPTTDINPEYNKEGFAAMHDTMQIPITSNATQGLLDQTFGEVLKTNPQAQQMIIQSMHITPEQFQEMLTTAQNNNMMHMTIRELITSGAVQQATMQQETPEPVDQAIPQNSATPLPPKPAQQLQSFVDTVKGWFK